MERALNVRKTTCGFLKLCQSQKNTTKIIPPELNSFMSQYENKTCLHYNHNTEKYFRFKRNTSENKAGNH